MQSTLKAIEGCSRQTLLKGASVLAIELAVSQKNFADQNKFLFDEKVQALIIRYLESLSKPDGGYGWREQDDSYLSVSYSVIGAYLALEKSPPRKKELVEFVRKGHPMSGHKSESRVLWSELKEFTTYQIQALLWLGEGVKPFENKVKSWKKLASNKPYEKQAHSVMRHQLQPIFCRRLMGMPVDEVSPIFDEYLKERERENGSFNNTRSKDGGDGHIMNTYFGLKAKLSLGLEPAEALFEWLQKCQKVNGGFSWSPNALIGDIEDVTYTWAGVKTLSILGKKPLDSEKCIEWLQSLWNEDGGFSDRPGAPSSAMATHLALETLRLLNGSLRAPQPRKVNKALPANLKAYTIQIQAPGEGSIKEAVEMARVLGIHLWGAKNPLEGWVESAQKQADLEGVPVKFFTCHEEYGSHLNVDGLGNYNHIIDPIYSPKNNPKLYTAKNYNWKEFQEEKIKSLHESNNMMSWQACENEEFTRVLLDESILKGGYDVIGSFHFWAGNFVWSLPFLKRYEHEIPFVALQDAHGESWWWSTELSSNRTVFYAHEPTWEGWLEAVENNRVVSVRRDSLTKGKLRMIGGTAAIRQKALETQDEWKWWDDKTNSILEHHPVSVVVLDSSDKFETGHRETSRVLRIRLRHSLNKTKQELLPEEYKLISIKIDGKEVESELKERFFNESKKNPYDIYRIVDLASFKQGEHRVELYLNKVSNQKSLTYTKTINISGEN